MRRSKTKAKYLQIAEDIAKKIKSGKLKAGQKIPSENEIIKTEGVSCATSRKALLELELRGLVKRVKGKGTVVLESTPFFISRALGSFSAMNDSYDVNLKKDGISPKSEIFECTTFKGKKSIQIGKNFYEIVGKICKVHILRYGDGQLFKNEIMYFDAALCPNIADWDSYESIIGELSKRYSFNIKNVNRNLYAKILDVSDTYFKNKEPIALMILDGAVITESGRVVMIEESAYDAAKYKFTIDAKS